jgi:hypothetical protein
VPEDNPVTTPVLAFTTATGILLVVHVPPDVADASVDEPPIHADAVPVMAAGAVHEPCIVTL